MCQEGHTWNCLSQPTEANFLSCVQTTCATVALRVLPVHVLAQVDGLAIIISEVLVRLAVVAIVGAEKPLAAVPNEREHARAKEAATVRGHECVCVPSSCVLVCFLTGTHPDIVSSLAIA